MANLEDQIINELKPLLTGFPSKIKNAAIDLAHHYATTHATDIPKYLDALRSGHINKSDFDHLMKGQIALEKGYVITASALTISEFEHLRVAIVSALINLAFKAL
ncbi:hypothetical protein [Hansschlegelia beijingensis]|uniref:Uncharacterized protein n=1 Tax=Hansschlegelia beijingensis TaxID=1133344 RepID=A0A7W6D196_9HYPH|nr:hypothetical protein [Hansschlegelia beijingensis]MBB3972806.1 hypothetical protein [Hansschlegelia beijingensis]